MNNPHFSVCRAYRAYGVRLETINLEPGAWCIGNPGVGYDVFVADSIVGERELGFAESIYEAREILSEYFNSEPVDPADR